METRRTILINGKAAQLIVDLGGGSITRFHFQGQEISPLNWGATGESTRPRPMGHFLCLDRWGPASEAEQKNGMPYHGEASHVLWAVQRAPQTSSGSVHAEIAANLPLAGLNVKRSINFSENNAFFVVREEVTNVNKLGRIFNMVQHPTIGPPFLDEHTVVDSNGGRGLMQNSPLPNPEEPSVTWPHALKDGRPVDLRHLTNDHDPNVVSFAIDGEYGWVTACNPRLGLLIGYFWKTADYPWFSAWRHAENGKPVARGLEFGTTGLHQPFPILTAKGRIFGRRLYEYLDANETTSKSYACFLFKVPKDYKGVASVVYSGSRIMLHERESGPDRDLNMEVGKLFGGDAAIHRPAAPN